MSFKTPLHAIERQHGALFIRFQSWETAEHFGDPDEEYRAVRESVAVFDLSYLGKLRVSGRDRAGYLHRMLSNDIRGLEAGNGCYATLLTHQGHMESDLHCYAFHENLWLVSPPSGLAATLATLHRHIVGEKVEIEDRTFGQAIVSLQGPGARTVVERVLGAALPDFGALEHRSFSVGASYWVVTRMDRTGCGGYDLWLPADEAPSVWLRLVDAEKVQHAGHRCLNWLRTEAGIPWYGVDMDERSLPMMFGLDSALSLSKGCYRGQEIVARILHRGHLDRRLGGVAVDHDELPAPGSEIRSQGGRIGAVTSSIASPRLRRPLALAVMKIEFSQPGTPVTVVSDEVASRAEVVALPLQ